MQRQASEASEPFTVWLACGCEPLHLRTFLAAELMERLAPAPVEVRTGVAWDSLRAVVLVALLEETFDVRIPARDYPGCARTRRSGPT